MYATKSNERHYPDCCQSYACGKSGDECNQSCRYWKYLAEFKRWRERHNAYRPDPVWLPTLWVAGA